MSIMWRWRCKALVGLVLATIVTACGPPPSEANYRTHEAEIMAQFCQDLLTRISNEGASAVVRSISSKGDEGWDEWDRILKGVESGEENWLALAVGLRPGTDAHFSETLDVAVCAALNNNPAGVLSLMAEGGAFENEARFICSVGLFDGEPMPLEAGLAALDAKRRAVRSVTAPERADLCESCLKYLDESEAEYRVFATDPRNDGTSIVN